MPPLRVLFEVDEGSTQEEADEQVSLPGVALSLGLTRFFAFVEVRQQCATQLAGPHAQARSFSEAAIQLLSSGMPEAAQRAAEAAARWRARAQAATLAVTPALADAEGMQIQRVAIRFRYHKRIQGWRMAVLNSVEADERNHNAFFPRRNGIFARRDNCIQSPVDA